MIRINTRRAIAPALLAVACLLSLAACASAPPGAVDRLPQEAFLHRLQTATAAYNVVQQAVTAAADSGFITAAQKASIDPFGRAAEQTLRGAVAALQAWNASGEDGDRAAMIRALVKLETAGLKLHGEWNRAQRSEP